MTFQYKIVSPLKQLGVLFIILSPQLFLVLGSTFQADQIGGIDLSSKEMITKAKWMQVFSSLAFFVIPAFLFSVFTIHTGHLKFLGFKRPGHSAFLPLAGICILISAPVVFWLGQINELIPLPERFVHMEEVTGSQVKAFLQADNTMDILFNVFVLALVPAIAEEILFRGAMQSVFIRLTRNPWTGIILSAIIFSALHLQFAGFLPRFFLGVLLGAFYWFSGSLWVPIFAHFVYNGIQVVAASFYPDLGDKNPEVPVLAAIVSAAIVTYIIYLFKSKSTSQIETVTEQNKQWH